MLFSRRISTRAVASSEFIWIVLAIAIAAILVITLFGRKIASVLATTSKSIDEGKPITPPKIGMDIDPPAKGVDLTPGPDADPLKPDPAKPPTPGDTTVAPSVDPNKPVNPMDLSPEERAGRTFFIETPTGAEVTIFDPKGNKIAKASVNKVDAKTVGYDKAAFAGRGTLNFCNGTTYTADLTVLGAKGEAKGPGVNFGGSENEKDLRTGEKKKGEPSVGVDLFKVGGEVVGVKVEGG